MMAPTPLGLSSNKKYKMRMFNILIKYRTLYTLVNLENKKETIN